jgi:hypothetical protein
LDPVFVAVKGTFGIFDPHAAKAKVNPEVEQ